MPEPLAAATDVSLVTILPIGASCVGEDAIGGAPAAVQRAVGFIGVPELQEGSIRTGLLGICPHRKGAGKPCALRVTSSGGVTVHSVVGIIPSQRR